MGILSIFKKNKSTDKNNRPLYLYSEEELDEYEAYIEKSLGSYSQVLHEIASPDIHLDVIPIPATDDAPFLKLVTMGAGAYKMDIPETLKDYEIEYAEYVIYLPKDWNLSSPDEKDYWPVRALKDAGRLPVAANTWLGYGHTIQANEEGTPYAENTGFNCTMLVTAVDLNGEPMSVRLSSGKLINFYQLIPIYPEELLIKQEQGADALLDLLAEDDGFPVVDINRRNVAKE